MMPKMIRKWKDLCAEIGENTPYAIGRRIYKSIDCGPWTVILTRAKPTITRRLKAIVRPSEDGLCIHVIGDDLMKKDFEGFCGFDDRKICDCGAKSFGEYVGIVRDFDKTNPGEITFYTFKQSIHIYRTYTSIEDFGQIYYEDSNAREQPKDVVGIRFGSIVEGSGYTCGPEDLLFPFKASDLWTTLESINQEACDAWNEANGEEYDYEADDRNYMAANGN